MAVVLILPVIDLLQGQVVAARAGRRSTYQPLQSPLANDARPKSIAAAYASQLKLDQVYVADLDAIHGAAPAWAIYEQIAAQGLQLWIDAGAGLPASVAALAARSGAGQPFQPIVGLETLASRQALHEILHAVERQRVVVSLDLRHGRPWTKVETWRRGRSIEVAKDLLDMGVERMILLDVSRVGRGAGVGTRKLLREIRRRNKVVELYCGGGIQSIEQVRQLRQEGCDGVLIGTMLHTGKLNAATLREMERL